MRDPRYDLDIDYNLIGQGFADSVAFTLLDVNGDGAADIVGDDLRYGAPAIEYPQAFVSRSDHSDLLRLVRNGTDGTKLNGADLRTQTLAFLISVNRTSAMRTSSVRIPRAFPQSITTTDERSSPPSP